MGERHLADFFTSWQTFTETHPANPLFKEWAAVFTISAALTRRAWAVTDPTMPRLFPNLYVKLVGKPGSGKDVAITPAHAALREANHGADDSHGLHIGQNVSAKGIVDALLNPDAQLLLEYKQKRESFHSIILCVPELATILPEYDSRLIGNLCDLYNCRPEFIDQVRNGKGEAVFVERPHVAVIFGATPSFISELFPESAYQMGYFSRFLLVHGEILSRRPLYLEGDTDEQFEIESNKLWQNLISDLKQIICLTGQFKIPPAVRKHINQFHVKDCDKTALNYSRFEDYNTRRSFHAQKLAMCFSASRSDDMIIQLEDWKRALDLLLRTEKFMPSIYTNTVNNKGFHGTVEEVLFAAKLAQEGREVVREQELIRMIRKKHRPAEVMLVLNSMINGGELEVLSEKGGLRTFRIRNDVKLKLVGGTDG